MRIRPMDAKSMSVNELVREYKKGVFGAGRMAAAIDIFEKMIVEKATVFLGLSGALIPAGMGGIVCTLIKRKMVHVIVSTGANVTHDLIEAFGGRHLKGVSGSDVELRKKGIDRIYDAYVEDKVFIAFEKKIKPILYEIQKRKKRLVASELMFEIGARLKKKDSLVRAAYENGVPIFVPALSDSILGLQTFLFSQEHEFLVDETGDLGRILDIASSAKKSGVVILGGGVPKNFIMQTMLMLPRAHDFVIQITTATPQDGGLSGATLSEAISWGKVSEKSRLCTIHSDATIAFPLLVAATMERLQAKGYF